MATARTRLTIRSTPGQWIALLLVMGLLLTLVACGGSGGGSSPPPGSGATRTWQMGFYNNAPRYGDMAAAIENIDRLSQRAEMVAIHEELPWDLLLDGSTSLDAILDTKTDLIAYLRSKNLDLFFMADLTDGLSRGEEPPALRDLNRSITEVIVQQRYRDYVAAYVQRFQPEYIGLTAETNLVRRAAPAAVYDAMVQAANDAADDLVALGVTAPLLISVQVETAWGLLGSTGLYEGIEQDFADFPFMDILGLSSYPYFDWDQPEDIPDDYYTRLLDGRTFPAMVCEGGWPSQGVATIVSTPQLQERYITRHAALLDSIRAGTAIQTLFTDIDLSSVPPPYPANLPLFVSLGLMQLSGSDFVAKPALDAWDTLFARPLQ